MFGSLEEGVHIDVLEVFQVLGLSRLVGGNVNAFLGLDGVAYFTGDELK